MWVRTQGFHVPKRGNTESEYEDAFFPLQLCQYNLSKFHCAVADGASESVYSGEWARLLVRGYCRQRLSLESMQRCWLKLANSRPAPWYLEEKIRRGAHAALVGLSISAEPPSKETLGGSWEAEAVGDSCFFHIRDDELLKVGPLCNSDEFNNHPHLIPSTASGSINDLPLRKRRLRAPMDRMACLPTRSSKRPRFRECCRGFDERSPCHRAS